MASPTRNWLTKLKYTQHIRTHLGVKESNIKWVEKMLNCCFPADYRDFFLATNGCEFVQDSRIIADILPLWSPISDAMAIVGTHGINSSEPYTVIFREIPRPGQIGVIEIDRHPSDTETEVKLFYIGFDDGAQSLVFLRDDLSSPRDYCPVYCFIEETSICVKCTNSFHELIELLCVLKGNQYFSPIYADSILLPHDGSLHRPWWKFWN